MRLRARAAARGTTWSSQRDPLLDDLADAISGDTFLFERVTVAQRNGSVLQCLSVDGEAEWRSDLVLPPIPATDGGRLVVKHREAFSQILRELVGELGHAVFFDERKDTSLDRRERRMKSENDAAFVLAFNLLFAVRIYQQREQSAVRAGRRLD